MHVLSLVGFRSRLSVLMEWAFAYFTWQRRSRVILEVPSAPPVVAQPSVIGHVLRLERLPVDGVRKDPPPAAREAAGTDAHPVATQVGSPRGLARAR